MASEKPVSGPDPQPAGLISVGAGGGGGGGGSSSSSSVAVMGELRASGSGSVVLPAGMINPSVPIRNIRMKFAVLIGLIQVGEVSNRDIVETVLNLLVGGEFDLEMNFIIQDAESITCMSELLEHCDVTCQAEIWSMFTAILRKSVRNLQTSTEVGLIEQVLLKMSTVDDMIADLLVDMLGVLASYSITVKELKLLFSMLRGENGIWPRHAVKLLSVLNQMPQRHGPDTFFNFPGCSAAIALPPIAKWPYQNGFTLNTWFRMDPLNNINVDKDKPYLYCFRTSKGVGYSAHFVGNCLIVTSLKSKGKGFQHCVKYDFQPRKWYMISIVHIYNRWRNSEIRCYVNGQLVSYGDMAWHVNTNDSYDKCFLGSSETADANRVFCGQLGAVYVFTEALNPAQIFAIHQLGPGYKSTFKFKSESDIHLAEHHKQVLYDGKLASSIAFTYNAKATDAQLCLESSPKENPSIFVHSPHALMLQDVKAIVTHSIHSAIHSIGGIQVLFPLFAQLDNRQLHDSQVETTVCATLLAFLVELLKSSVAMQEQMLGGKGFLVIGYLLEKSSRVHITRAVLEQFLSFAKYLDGLSHGAPLLKQLCDHILFNPAIWIHTPAKVQLSLYTYLSAEFIGTATIYNTIRRVGTVLQLMHTLKYYYWVVNPADSSGITPKGLDGPRPSQKEIISLRAFMLLFLKQLILKDRGVKEDELQSILNYLLTMHEDENIHDVLQLLVALMSEHPASMIPELNVLAELMEVRRLFLSDMIKLFSNSRENRRCLLQCSVWQDWMFSLGYINPKNSEEQKITEMVYNIFRILLYHAIKYEWGGWRVWVDTLSIAHSKVTYEAHKEYLAKMYEEYQRQEEENIKKGKKGNVSTISGLSSQTTGAKGGMEIREIEDLSQSQSPESETDYPVSTDTRDLLMSTKVSDDVLGSAERPGGGVHVEVHDLLVDIKAEKVEATEVKLDDMDLSPETLVTGENGALVEVESLLDNVYSAAVEKLQNNVHGSVGIIKKNEEKDNGPLITLADEKDEPSTNSTSFLFDKIPSQEEKLLPELSSNHISIPNVQETQMHLGVNDDLGLLAHMTGSVDITCTSSIIEDKEFKIHTTSDGMSSISERELASSSKGLEYAEMTATTLETESSGSKPVPSAVQGRSVTQQDRDLRVDLGFRGMPMTEEQRRQFSPGPRTTMFRIPEFKWSPMHQRLLTDLLFALETDVHVWRSHSTKSVMDFVNSNENIIFVHNTIHLISQMVDNIIIACGGILPLLSAATSPTTELENIEVTQGMSAETAVTFLSRLMAMVDVLVFASSLNFSEIEAEKNMSSGGLMRQCLRLVCCVAVRNCLECRQRQRERVNKTSLISSKTQDALQGVTAAATPLENVPGNLSPIKDPDRLLQDVDINRLRAVVFRDDDSKQAQFLALAVVYFISVLMVSKYRDILEPQRETARSGSQAGRNIRQEINSPTSTETPTPVEDIQLESSIPHTDSGIGDEQMPNILNGTDLETSTGPDAMSELLSTLSSEVKKSQESLTESPSEILKPASSISSISQSKGINVKEILKSLVAAPVEIAECGPDPIPYPDPALKREAQAILPMQFHSFDRYMAGFILYLCAVDSGSSSSSSSSSFVNGATSKNLPAVQTVAPMPEDSAENMSITAKLERALEKVAPLLREIFVDFAPFLSRTLLGSHGQELLIEGTLLRKSSGSEWQNSIQKNAGLAFIELINEGRLLCHAMKDHIVRVANEAEFILNRQRAEDVHKHAEFESQCAQYAADRREEEKMCDHLISAAKHRDHVTANQLKQKILNILTNKHGAWGAVSHSQLHDFWRLDYWEDDLRRRRRFVRNAFGSTHSDALLKAAVEYGTEEDVVKSKKTFRSQAVVNQNAETELMLEGDDDAVSLLQEKEIDNLAGPVVLSTPAQLIAPVVVAKGTLSITTTEIYFEVDEDDPAFKKIDPKVLAYTEGLHGKWMFSEIRAVFSRRYLLQNTALEVFMANRTSVMFNFPDQATVKKVVYSLPRVGVGTSYGLPQARRISLATPRQLYKSSNMTQRWQRREISNFEYLMFLNTIAGRTYNDLNQYPVFPWVLTNYESEELDLTLPGNFRDLSKPIGALNPKRAVFYAERYETWEDDQTPPYHYNTHYSTSTSTLAWLVRIEPFTTFFLNANDGKFDHPDRTFSSVARSWRNSQRDTSDVKELIPEFYYLPEMFVNSNGYSLGIREDEVVVNDVDLPPWAKKPEDFVRINRMALESEFVSCQLHQWIDLIFGYKQRGPEAVRALNVFHYLTYEGSVNLDSITDPVLREAMEAQIQNFGQTPSQLLIEPHPPRSSAMHLSPLMFKDQMQQDVIMVLKFPSNSPVTHVAANTLPHLTIPAVVTVTCSRLFAVNRWHNTVAPGYSLDQAHHLPIEMDPLIANNSGVNKRQITDLVDQSIQINAHCFVVTADNRYILICGFWDKSFRVYSTETGKLTQIVFGHWDVVTCLARSESYIGGDCYIVSGSRDATLLLWYWSGRHHIIGDNPNSSDYPAPRAVLTGHDHEVVCVSVCAELGLVISGAKEGPCLVHTITGDLLRALEGTENCLYPRLISVSSEGHCIIYYERGRFSNFSINGKLLAQMEINDSTRAILLSSDGQNLVTGGDNGVVEVWQACDFKQLYIYPGCDAGIRAMDLSHDQRTLITGMASGSIVAFNIDFNRWHYEHQNRY
uniref:Neurobeachin n=1 Tax=Falco tinnunculus TaxID=100819 RepID=A0A8C4VDC7_FALTI